MLKQLIMIYQNATVKILTRYQIDLFFFDLRHITSYAICARADRHNSTERLFVQL